MQRNDHAPDYGHSEPESSQQSKCQDENYRGKASDRWHRDMVTARSRDESEQLRMNARY